MEYSIRRNRDDQWAMPQPHQHDCLEVLLSLTEGGSFFLMDNRYSLQKGTLIVLQDHVLHRSVAVDGDYERYVLHIPRQTLEEASSEKTDFLSVIKGNHCLQLDDTAFRQIQSLMEQCHASSDEFGEDVLQNCAFFSLLVMLGRLLSETTLFSVPKDGLSASVRQAVDWINGHLSEGLSLETLAEHCYVTKYHLCRLFKAETGFTVVEYIIRQRLLRAATLLRAGESVQKAGEEAGFQNYNHFIRTFSRLMGISPGRYQRQHRASHTGAASGTDA